MRVSMRISSEVADCWCGERGVFVCVCACVCVCVCEKVCTSMDVVQGLPHVCEHEASV